MSIRIWHQSFTVLSDLGAYDEALRAHFRKVARPGTQIHMHGMLPGTYRNNYPGDDIKYSALQYLHGLQFMAAGINAQDQGFDAYAISTLPEPALKETRSLLDIPVVGYGESAMLTACMLGRTSECWCSSTTDLRWFGCWWCPWLFYLRLVIGGCLSG
jgi:hypothetical protein